MLKWKFVSQGSISGCEGSFNKSCGSRPVFVLILVLALTLLLLLLLLLCVWKGDASLLLLLLLLLLLFAREVISGCLG